MTTRAVTAHTIPAAHALDLLDIVAIFGVSAETLLEGSGLTRTALAAADARISVADAEQTVARAIALTKQPALGIMLGMRMRVPAHGFLGFAAMTAPTVQHALSLAVRYAPTRTSALSLRVDVGEQVALFIDEHADFGRARETLMLALAVGLWRIGEALTGTRLVGTADFAFAQPAFALPLAGTPFSVRFGQAHNALYFSRTYLDLPLTMAEPSASRLAEEQCERALEALDRSGLAERVRALVPRLAGGVNTVDDVAAGLGISSRTLHRKLKTEGLVFSEVVDTVQADLAVALLADAQLSVEAVAERVGYSDVSNFARAFKRWTGSTPAAYRRTKLARKP